MDIRDRIQEFRRVPASELIPNESNWREHPQFQVEAMKGVLEEIGFAGAHLTYKREDGALVLIDGHLRHELCGDHAVPVLVTDLTEDEAKKLLLVFDPISQLASMNEDKLLQLAKEVAFDDAALKALIADLQAKAETTFNPDPDIEPDEVFELPADPIAVLGDIWELGPHRIWCGDSTDLAGIERLFGNQRAQMCFTDPPYNVAYEGKTKKKLKIENDQMSGSDFLDFLRSIFGTIFWALDEGCPFWICYPDCESLNFHQAVQDSGLSFRQCIVWVKNTLVLGRRDYQCKHEMILYGWKLGAKHRFFGNRKQTTVVEDLDGLSIQQDSKGFIVQLSQLGKTVALRVPSYEIIADGCEDMQTVWRFDKPSRNADHPTMKPIELCERAVKHGSKRGEIVFDPCLGSGSTLIAAERVGRVCFGVELDPKYCDVIIKRWELLSGLKARRLGHEM